MFQINPITFVQNLSCEISSFNYSKLNLFNHFFATQTLQNSRIVDAKIITPTIAVAGSVSNFASTIDFFLTSAACAGGILLTKGFLEFKDPFEADKKKAKIEMIGGSLLLSLAALRITLYILPIFSSERVFEVPEKNASPFSVAVGFATLISPIFLARCCGLTLRCSPKTHIYDLASWIFRPH